METKIIRLFNRFKLRTLQLVLLGLLLISSHTQAQQISNVVAEQNGKSIVVKYDITAKADQSYSISLLYSSDGVIWKEAITGLSGDIGNNQKGSGTKQFTWLPLSELPKLVGNGYSFKVKAKITTTQMGKLNSVDKEDFEKNMIFVKGGTFQMGCNLCANKSMPILTVTLNDFHICKFEITQAQWVKIMGYNPSYFKGCNDCPVESISFDEIQIFINKLNIKTGKHYRLPTEAEWEYAARGGINSEGYKYSGSDYLEEIAWYAINSKYETHPIGQKKPNELGLYDMTGNVMEWCSYFWWNYKPNGAEFNNNKFTRGGSWYQNKSDLSIFSRSFYTPTVTMLDLGFRLAE